MVIVGSEMSVKSRTEFIRTIVWESSALILTLFLYLALILIFQTSLYLFASSEIAVGEKFLVSLAFEDWLFLIIVELSFLITYFWRFIDYKEKVEVWKSENDSFSLKTLILSSSKFRNFIKKTLKKYLITDC
jgi:hypothetical protein